MDSPRASLKSSGRLGWRILLGTVGLAGAIHFAMGMAGIVTLWSWRELWRNVWFSVPYVILLVMFYVGSGMAFSGRLRVSAILVLSAVILSVGLFAYDVTHYRAQYRVGPDGAFYYVFWWWWQRWGEICVT